MTALLPYHKPNNDSNLYRNLLTALSIWDIKDVNESATKANLPKMTALSDKHQQPRTI
jgi:hypothetical protein